MAVKQSFNKKTSLLHPLLYYSYDLKNCGTLSRVCKIGSHLVMSISLSVDIETNAGPLWQNQNKFSICHWNLNSITAHGYAKMPLLKAYADFLRLLEIP